LPAPSPALPGTIPDGGSAPAYLEWTHYAAGDRASFNGNEYECVQPNWCSGAAWAYAPKSGTAWFQAWNLMSGCGDGDEHGTTTSLLISPAAQATWIDNISAIEGHQQGGI
jgi:hypothetical protein